MRSMGGIWACATVAAAARRRARTRGRISGEVTPVETAAALAPGPLPAAIRGDTMLQRTRVRCAQTLPPLLRVAWGAVAKPETPGTVL